jgi:hypothetical protein
MTTLWSAMIPTLSVWRVTHLLNAENGPWDLVVRLRRVAGGSFFGQLLDCFYCLSLWVALPAALLVGHGAKDIVLLWLALSAGAILLERLTMRPAAVPPATYWEEKGDPDVLRKEETGTDDGSAGHSH